MVDAFHVYYAQNYAGIIDTIQSDNSNKVKIGDDGLPTYYNRLGKENLCKSLWLEPDNVTGLCYITSYVLN